MNASCFSSGAITELTNLPAIMSEPTFWLVICTEFLSTVYYWRNWTCSSVWKFYFQNISRVLLEHFHNTEYISILWNWTNYVNWIFQPFSTIFPNISILWKRSHSVSHFKLVDSCGWVLMWMLSIFSFSVHLKSCILAITLKIQPLWLYMLNFLCTSN